MAGRQLTINKKQLPPKSLSPHEPREKFNRKLTERFHNLNSINTGRDAIGVIFRLLTLLYPCCFSVCHSDHSASLPEKIKWWSSAPTYFKYVRLLGGNDSLSGISATAAFNRWQSIYIYMYMYIHIKEREQPKVDTLSSTSGAVLVLDALIHVEHVGLIPEINYFWEQMMRNITSHYILQNINRRSRSLCFPTMPGQDLDH